MNIKVELVKNHIADFINSHIDEFEINADKIANTVATNMVSEIWEIVKNDNLNDFEVMEEIVLVFEKRGINSGSRHDF